MRTLSHFLLLLAFTLIAASIPSAQQPEKSVCDEERAVLLAEKQVEEAKAIDQPPKQIAVMIRAADLLWKYQPASARKIFSDAFDLAEKHYKERGDEMIRDGRSATILPDQRFLVMRGIAKRDAAWAKQLAARIVEETRKQAENPASAARPSNNQYQAKVQDKILELANATVSSNPETAAALIRSSFAYPPSVSLTLALYGLRAVNQATADALYQEAIKAYADAPINEVLYLGAYPFLRGRIIGIEMYMNGFSSPLSPPANPTLQQLFTETLLRRAEAVIKLPDPPVNGVNKLPESSQLLIAFTELESLAAQFQPSYTGRIAEMKGFLNAALSAEMRQAMNDAMRPYNQTADRDSGGNSFTKYLEQADREPNPDSREHPLALAVLSAPFETPIETLTSIIRRIDDEKLRGQLLTSLYFKRTQKAIETGDFFQASQYVRNIEQLDLRAYLSYEIAAAALKKEQDRPRAKDALDEVLTVTYKAPSTNEKARTLLGVVFLYAKIDLVSAFAVMTEAVKTINNIENPDFSSGFVQQRIEGKYFSMYSSYSVEGFDLEKVFRLLAPLDFEGALYRARSLDDRSQRGLAILALAASCLDELEKTKKHAEEKKKPTEPDLKPEEAKKPTRKRP